MRTLSGPVSPHSSWRSRRRDCSAAWSASDAVENAAQKASPMVLNTTPSLASMACRSTASCRARAERIASGYCSHSLVLPSISVNRNVTVPLGRSIALLLPPGRRDIRRTADAGVFACGARIPALFPATAGGRKPNLARRRAFEGDRQAIHSPLPQDRNHDGRQLRALRHRRVVAFRSALLLR